MCRGRQRIIMSREDVRDFDANEVDRKVNTVI